MVNEMYKEYHKIDIEKADDLDIDEFADAMHEIDAIETDGQQEGHDDVELGDKHLGDEDEGDDDGRMTGVRVPFSTMAMSFKRLSLIEDAANLIEFIHDPKELAHLATFRSNHHQ